MLDEGCSTPMLSLLLSMAEPVEPGHAASRRASTPAWEPAAPSMPSRGLMHRQSQTLLNKDGKRKRIHPTKAQLNILEASFQACPKPSSKARLAISEKIQLNERCVQIWFQNRRARERKMIAAAAVTADATDVNPSPGAVKAPGFSSSSDSRAPFFNEKEADDRSTVEDSSALDSDALSSLKNVGVEPSTSSAGTRLSRRFSMPELSINRQKLEANHDGLSSAAASLSSSNAGSDLHFQASSLVIGTWRRVCISSGDLVCSFNPVLRSLRWLVIESGYGFQMEFPLENIVDVIIGRANALTATITIEISAAPSFMKEVRISSDSSTGPKRMSVWVPCSDFTEGSQASVSRRHILSTSASDPVIMALFGALPILRSTITALNGAKANGNFNGSIPAEKDGAGLLSAYDAMDETDGSSILSATTTVIDHMSSTSSGSNIAASNHSKMSDISAAPSISIAPLLNDLLILHGGSAHGSSVYSASCTTSPAPSSASFSYHSTATSPIPVFDPFLDTSTIATPTTANADIFNPFNQHMPPAEDNSSSATPCNAFARRQSLPNLSFGMSLHPPSMNHVTHHLLQHQRSPASRQHQLFIDVRARNAAVFSPATATPGSSRLNHLIDGDKGHPLSAVSPLSNLHHRGRSASLSGLEAIFQHHGISRAGDDFVDSKSPAVVNGGGSEFALGVTSSQLASISGAGGPPKFMSLPILEVPEPMSPGFSLHSSVVGNF